MKEKITITMEYGSEPQKTIWRKSLMFFFDVLKVQMREGHKDNKIRVKIEEIED